MTQMSHCMRLKCKTPTGICSVWTSLMSSSIYDYEKNWFATSEDCTDSVVVPSWNRALIYVAHPAVKCWDVQCPMSYVSVKQPTDQLIIWSSGRWVI